MTSSGDEASSSNYPPPPFTASRTYIEIKALEILMTKAIEILMTNDLTKVTKLIKNLFYGKESSSSSKLLYNSFTHYFPDCIAIKLIKIYRYANVSATIDSFSLELLDSLLEDSRVRLKNETLREIKPLLNYCLWLQDISDHDLKLISSILSRVSVNKIYTYIACISNFEYKKPLAMFIDLPLGLEDTFLITLLENDLHLYILHGLLKRDIKDEEDWCLFLEAGFNMTLQIVNSQRDVLVYDLIYAIVKSIWKMIKVKRREIVVRKGLVKLAKRVRREAVRFREEDYEVVTRLVSMIKSIDGVGELTKMALNLILEVLDKYYMRPRGFVRSEMVRLFTRSASLISRFRVL